MTEEATFVLDTSVLSSFYSVDWEHAFEFWATANTTLTTPERIWSEFEAHHDISPPPWMDVRTPDLESPQVERPMQLSIADWACIILAEEVQSGIVVTNDRAMHDVAERRGIDSQWGTQFLLSTFKQCGIEKDELESGLGEYAADLGLNEGVVQEIRSAEK